MWNRIIEAFTKPKLQQTPIDEAIVTGCALLAFAVVFGIAAYIIHRHGRAKKTARQRHAESVARSPVASGEWAYDSDAGVSRYGKSRLKELQSRPLTTSPAPPPRKN